MLERERSKETIDRGDLFYLTHPDADSIFSGYGLALEPGNKQHLAGVLMVDRPTPANPAWLHQIADTFGECLLVPMTTSGERGLVCQMIVDDDSLVYLQQSPTPLSNEIQQALEPLLDYPPAPQLRLSWDEESKLWHSEPAMENVLPAEIRELFHRTGYGCLALESDIGIVHVCHAPDDDISGFFGKPVNYQWQLIKMPTAPLLRLQVDILDDPLRPFVFESFLNVAEESQANVINELAEQDRLYLAFYGNDLTHRFTITVPHDEQQWQRLDDLDAEALHYWEQLPEHLRDFDLAKAAFLTGHF